MRWYFAIDEAGAAGELGALARLAVASARAVGGLEPVLLYFGARNEFTAWMQDQRVSVLDAQPPFMAQLRAAIAAGTYRPHSVGHWLRLAVPQIETSATHVLYTDCDVIFLRPFDWEAVRPAVFAAAPEFRADNFNYFNAGVMVLNVAAMRATYPALEADIIARIATTGGYTYDDQIALNEAYHGRWTRLDPVCNWKPYWPADERAALLHFHGPKPAFIQAIAAGGWAREDAAGMFFAKLLHSRLDCYLAWCRRLGDGLQTIDLGWALTFAALASALTRLAPGPAVEDILDFNMFAVKS